MAHINLPRQIRLTETNDILDLHTGAAYLSLNPGYGGKIIRPYDYVGIGVHITTAWMLHNLDKWEAI